MKGHTTQRRADHRDFEARASGLATAEVCRQHGISEQNFLSLGGEVQVQAGMGVAVADFDNDGFLDIAKTNFSGDLPSLYKNEDGKFFTDVSQQSGLGRNQLLGWGVAFLYISRRTEA